LADNELKQEIFEDPRKVISDALVELGGNNKNVIFISCDSSLGASGGEFNKRLWDPGTGCYGRSSRFCNIR
jgi:hypothetical protein